MDAIAFVPVEPTIDDVRVTRLEQAGAGNSMRRLALSDLEEGSTALADIGFGVVVTIVDQGLVLGGGQVEGSATSHEASFLLNP
jgi:hypothetical protein